MKNKNTTLWLTLVLLATFFVYLPTLSNHFINYDDNPHLLDNFAVRGLDLPHLQAMFTMTVHKVYAPLTFVSFALEYHFFQYAPFIYHLDNLLLHLGVTALIFCFALQTGLSLRAAFIAALLFGIHPMHVESVAWVTERKDVLYALFYMMALCFYWEYLSKREKIPYCAALACGLLSILAKPMALSLPLILLACDWLKKRQTDKAMVLDKIPFLLYIIPTTWITYSLHARIPGEGILSGTLIWIWTSMFYIQKFLFPSVLVPIYALPQPVQMTQPAFGGAWILLAAVAIGLWIFRRQRWVWFAFVFYFLSLFFIFRFDAVADKNIVADRFMYLPSLGFCFLAGYAADLVYPKFNSKKISAVLIAIAFILGLKTFSQSQIWRDSISFWDHELKYYPNNALAYGNRGEAYRDLGKFQLALNDYNRSIALDPAYAESYNSRGQIYGMQGDLDGSLRDFLKTVELNPNFDEAYNNIGIIYAMKKDYEKAVQNFNKALAIDPLNSEAHYNLAEYYYLQKEYKTAFIHFRAVLELNPQSKEAYARIKQCQKLISAEKRR